MITPIQVSISGYASSACSLFSVYDTESKILVISAETEFRKQRREGCVLITNDKTIDRDALFSEDDFSSAIGSFFELQGGISSDGASGRLVFSDKVTRANPNSAIEKDGYTESGQKFRISESISNLQIAALATCNYANRRADSVESSLNILDFFSGDIEIGKFLTI